MCVKEKEERIIDEMALAICNSRVGGDIDDCRKCGGHTECLYQEIAYGLYKADYRKQSEVASDIIEQIEDNFEIGYGGAYEFKMLLAELKNKYKVEKK